MKSPLAVGWRRGRQPTVGGRPNQLGARDHGAAVVEFALVVVLLLSMVIAVVEGGRLFIMNASLASAARDAAREMAISGDQGRAQTTADDAFLFGVPAWDAGESKKCPATPTETAYAQVSLTYTTGMMTGFWPNTFELRGTGVMRCGG